MPSTPGAARNPKPAETAIPLRSMYVIEGPERYLKEQAVGQIRRAVLGIDGDPLASSKFGPSAGLADVLDELRTPSLLGGRRLVIVQDADLFIRQNRQALERYCEQPSESAVLVLICKTLAKNLRLYKIVQKTGLLISCESLKGGDLNSWIVQQAQSRYGKRMDLRTAGALQRLAGDDLSCLDNELAKLAIYVGHQHVITPEAVDGLVGCHREEKVFGIADALARREPAAALALWEQAWQTERAAPMRAAGGLAWSLRRNLESKIFMLEGGSPDILQRKFWKRPDDVGRVSLEEFEDQLTAMGRAEASVLRGLTRSLQVAMEKMIISVCAKPGGRASAAR